jgi:high-affinity iron transporter
MGAFNRNSRLHWAESIGTILHGLIGYETQPAGMQVLVYVLVLVAIASGMRWVAKRAQATHGTGRTR